MSYGTQIAWAFVYIWSALKQVAQDPVYMWLFVTMVQLVLSSSCEDGLTRTTFGLNTLITSFPLFMVRLLILTVLCPLTTFAR